MFVHDFEKKVAGSFEFGAKLCAAAAPCLSNDTVKSLWRGICCESSELDLTVCDDLIFAAGEAERPSLDGNQYAVNVEKTGFCVVGDSKKGLINGFMTLLDLIRVIKITDEESVFEIECGSFKEKPRVKNQMVHFCVFPETELWELERFIRFCAALKFSHIVVEFWGMLRYDCLKELGWAHAFTKEQLRPLFKTANEAGIEIIPMFNHLGHASASRVMHGKHVVLDRNPKLQPLFSDDGWSWNVANPDTVKLLRNVRKELIDLCGAGEYFHLGCDEVYNLDLTPENCAVLTDYLNSVSAELEHCGRRPIVWGDMLVASRDSFSKTNRYTASCKDVETERRMLGALSRNIIIADWQYNVREAPVETALVFKEAGFDTILCPWDRTYCPGSVIPCVSTAAEYDLFGLLHTTWDTLSKGMPDVALAACCSWAEYTAENQPSRSYLATNAAKILRRVSPVNGDYKKAGWAKIQIATIT